MDLGNMRQLGVQHLIASCLSDACRQNSRISCPAEVSPTKPRLVEWIGRESCA